MKESQKLIALNLSILTVMKRYGIIIAHLLKKLDMKVKIVSPAPKKPLDNSQLTVVKSNVGTTIKEP